MTPKYSTETREAMASPFDASCWPGEPTGLPGGPHQLGARGLAQTIGLHAPMALVTVGADLMLHGADVMSAGLLIPFSAGAGLVLALIIYLAQRRWYGDDHNSAIIKALVVGLLTAIPSPLPYALFIPAGLVGLFRRGRS